VGGGVKKEKKNRSWRKDDDDAEEWRDPFDGCFFPPSGPKRLGTNKRRGGKAGKNIPFTIAMRKVD
jgi:hypothetical protein